MSLYRNLYVVRVDLEGPPVLGAVGHAIPAVEKHVPAAFDRRTGSGRGTRQRTGTGTGAGLACFESMRFLGSKQIAGLGRHG